MIHPKEVAEKIVDEFRIILMQSDTDAGEEILCTKIAKECALLTIRKIIFANPHSNPLNTDIHSTMDYWIEVEEEVEKI